MGSITIDAALMEQAGILPDERVQVVNNNNGERFETYTIPGSQNSGVICLNGAAARLAQPGDIVIIMAYTFFLKTKPNNTNRRLLWLMKKIAFVKYGSMNIMVIWDK